MPIGKPLYQRENKVFFDVEDRFGNLRHVFGTVKTVDAYGIFADDSKCYYDIIDEDSNCLYKHIPEDKIVS